MMTKSFKQSGTVFIIRLTFKTPLSDEQEISFTVSFFLSQKLCCLGEVLL